ncbi:hypothetical protein BKA70DRAFT_1493585 [Coprinopsis sp. MPI-PUGE-AT-0042]|nr:hypothetical protein BKA70DRAFT_1493585 [Coprinopsis sp. MPI-PUGE-AT-0042]
MATSALAAPLIGTPDQKAKAMRVFRATRPGHLGWSRNVDNERNYDYLLDVDDLRIWGTGQGCHKYEPASVLPSPCLMISTFKKLAAVAVLVAAVIAQDLLTVNTPIGRGDVSSGLPALVDFGELENDDPIRWVVDLAPGTSAFLSLQDSRGSISESGLFPILTGSDTSCVSQRPSSSVGPSALSSTGTPPGSSTSASRVPSYVLPSAGFTSSSRAPSSALIPVRFTSATSDAPSVSRSPTAVASGVSRLSHPPLGPIIGGTVGGLALISLTVVGLVSAVLPITPFLVTGQGPNPPNTSQVPQNTTVSKSEPGSSAFAPIFRNGKRASYSQPLPSTVPMRAPSDSATLPSRNMNEEDPPPRYEMEPSSEVGTSSNRP